MQGTAGKLKGFNITAKDGEIGTVNDVLFDDSLWTVRYLVVDTAKWLLGRHVVIAPVAIGKVNWEEKTVQVSLTKQQVENSPDLDTKDLSREYERRYYDFYGWPYYWIGGDVWGAGLYPGELALAGAVPLAAEAHEQARDRDSGDPHLRSTTEVTGYNIEATDGTIGHVEDFVIDDETWQIRYMIVDTKNWWPGKKVLVAPEWIERVSWADSRVYVDLSRDTIKKGPQFEPERFDRQYEENLYRHHDRPGYWVP